MPKTKWDGTEPKINHFYQINHRNSKDTCQVETIYYNETSNLVSTI